MYDFPLLKIYNFLETKITIANSSSPEQEENFYELLKIDHHKVGLLIGNIHEKKIPEEFKGPLIKGALKTLMKIHGKHSLNFMKYSQNIISKNFSYLNNFSLFYSQIDYQEKKIDFINAGPIYPILVRDGVARYLRFGHQINFTNPQSSFKQVSVNLRSNDLLLIVTNGLLNITDKNKATLGLKKILNFFERCSKDRKFSDLSYLKNFLNSFSESSSEKKNFLISFLEVR